MADQGSVTIWLNRLTQGELEEPARRLWERYYTQLVGLARNRLAQKLRAVNDEEDIALSALDSFVRAATAGRFPKLSDRDDLWRILFLLTTRKAAAAARRESRVRRGGGNVVPLSALSPDDLGGPNLGGHAPDPAEAAAVGDEIARLLGLLPSDLERELVALKLEGYTNVEIAQRIGKAVTTVERKLALIRSEWEAEVPPEPGT